MHGDAQRHFAAHGGIRGQKSPPYRYTAASQGD